MKAKRIVWQMAMALSGLLVLACGSSDGDSDPSDTNPDGTTGDSSVLIGTFQVHLVAPDTSSSTAGYTTVLGKVYDGATPSATIWEEKAAAGDCKLFTPRIPFCNPGCGSSVCVEDGVCKAYPTPKTVGTVTVTGLHPKAGGTGFSMDPVANNYQEATAAVELPYPASPEGEEITFAAAGGAYSAFTLKARGIAPLVISTTSYPLVKDQPLSLSWTPPGAGWGVFSGVAGSMATGSSTGWEQLQVPCINHLAQKTLGSTVDPGGRVCDTQRCTPDRTEPSTRGPKHRPTGARPPPQPGRPSNRPRTPPARVKRPIAARK